MSYRKFFNTATGLKGPFDYQQRLAEGEWPDLLDVPTGLGKTAAVTLAWLYKRHELRDPCTPRRLVWCLPMRALVEQTRDNVTAWLNRLDLLDEGGAPDKVSVHLLMGGEANVRRGAWTSFPEQDAVLIGTQDMLLSRALMRGYGMSRYQWPVHFALLHHDALWVFDEVQLMGSALPTTAQLEAFRRQWASRADTGSAPARSLWVSATLQESWLNTVDFRPHLKAGLRRQVLTDADHGDRDVQRRTRAPKALHQAKARLTAETIKQGAKSFIDTLADEVLAAHVASEQTLVIVNRVDRAQALHRALSKRAFEGELLLLHARFRPAERRAREQALHEPVAGHGRIVVATQAVEAGIDIDSRIMFAELAPWSSMIQRFGRCNRYGRFEGDDAATVYWIDIDEESKGVPEPYPAEALAHAREQLLACASASPQDLAAPPEALPAQQVLRRRDFSSLFNTDPDLSGFDVDVSPYIRDIGTPQAQVFWRDVDDKPIPEEPGPMREELCPVSLGQLRDHLKKKAIQAWKQDPLVAKTGAPRWVPLRGDYEARPGQVYLLAANQGGYDVTLGFVAGSKAAVEPVPADAEETSAEDFGSDDLSGIGRWITLDQHARDVASEAVDLAERLAVPEDERALLETAARWHDVGKAHEAFQRGIGADPQDATGPWAKSDGSGRPDFHVVAPDGAKRPRPHFRHELASMLAWIEHAPEALSSAHQDLVAYLIAAHHGRVRLGLRALPEEAEPDDSALPFARGVWHGDTLPALSMDGIELPATSLRLDLMRLGEGAQGASWSARTHALLERHGPFTLAWWEALLRIADWRASAKEARE